MNYSTVNLLKDGAMTQLQTTAKLYEEGYITAEECVRESSEILYSFIYALNDSGVNLDCIEQQHFKNFCKYKDWVNERIANERKTTANSKE